MNCRKCESKENGLLLPCNHFICTGCLQDLFAAVKGRTFGLACRSCGASFAIAKEPREGNTVAVKDDYKSEIEVLKDVKIAPCSGKIMGMTILKSDLYVVCSNPKHVIFKFDISVSGEKNVKPVELSISKMKWPRGIASSENHGCLYITDWDKIFGGKLWRYNCMRDHRVEDPVAVLDVQPFGVSVSPRSNEVLVTCATPVDVFHRRGWIYVYKSEEEKFFKTRVLNLPHLEIPRHAILTTSSLFLVCHGWTTTTHGVTSFQDPLAESPPADLKANGFYGCGRGSRFNMNRPLSMALDKDGLLLVVDYRNNRIHLMTDNLYLVRHLITAEHHPVNRPRHVCVDPSTGRIYVGQKNGRIIVFDGRRHGDGLNNTYN